MGASGRTAIVILNWNGEKFFDKFLPSVLRHSQVENTEIVVADNGSTDNSIPYLKQHFPSVKIIDLQHNYGFAEGYNQALKQVEADYLVLLNSDVEVSKHWLEPCLSHLEADEKIAAVQPKIVSFNAPEYFEYAGAAGGFIDKFGYPFCRGRILNHLEKDEKQYDEATQIFWATGACLFIRADVFKNAGGFDGDFFAHMEEIDLCWRLKNQGHKIVYEPQSTVYHLGGATLTYGSPQKIYLNFRNNLYMLYKNLPVNKFKRIFFIRMVLDGVAAAKFLLGFNFKEFGAVIRAHASFYRHLPQLIRKRKIIQKTVVKTEHPEIYPKSIMWKFFIQKKHKFSDLDFHLKKLLKK